MRCMCTASPSRVAVCFVFVPVIPTSLVFRRFPNPIELYTLLRSLQQKTDHLHCLNRRQLRRIQVWRLCTNVHGLDAGKPFLPPPESFVMFERSILGKLSWTLSRFRVGIIHLSWLQWKDFFNNSFSLTSIRFIRSIRNRCFYNRHLHVASENLYIFPVTQIIKIIRNADRIEL